MTTFFLFLATRAWEGGWAVFFSGGNQRWRVAWESSGRRYGGASLAVARGGLLLREAAFWLERGERFLGIFGGCCYRGGGWEGSLSIGSWVGDEQTLVWEKHCLVSLFGVHCSLYHHVSFISFSGNFFCIVCESALVWLLRFHLVFLHDLTVFWLFDSMFDSLLASHFFLDIPLVWRTNFEPTGQGRWNGSLHIYGVFIPCPCPFKIKKAPLLCIICFSPFCTWVFHTSHCFGFYTRDSLLHFQLSCSFSLHFLSLSRPSPAILSFPHYYPFNSGGHPQPY